MVNLGELVFSIIAEDKASTTVGAAAAKIGQAAAVAGAAVTAFGAGATLLIDRNREMDASFRTTALSMGVPAEAVKELARSLQSVDSPIAEVSASLDILALAGMDNVESMGQTASAFDTLADGIGVNADTLTGAMVPAFAALNIELEDAPQYVDGLATTFRTANVDLDDFSRLMERVGPDLGKMGLGLKDVEVILMALAEKGITGRKAMSELSKAIEESGGSSAALYRSLGITNTELGNYNTKLESSAGAAQEFADAQNSAFGTVDKLGFELDKLGQSAGDLLAPFEGVATACLGIGPAMTAAGSAASLLDNEMMVKLFPSLGKVVTGITGAGGLVPALGTFTTSLGLTTAGMTTFAVSAAAIAVPLVALVGVCALLGPAVQGAAEAWASFLGATKDTTAAIAGVEEQYDATTGAVVRYADAQEEAAIVAADASLKYDGITGAIIESADAQEEAAIIAADASLKYDECTGAIIENADAVAGTIIQYDEVTGAIIENADAVAGTIIQYDEVTGAIIEHKDAVVAGAEAAAKGGPKYDELVKKIGETGTAADVARKHYADYLLQIGKTAEYVDGAISKLSDLEIAQRTYDGTQATGLDTYTRGLQAGPPPNMADFASPMGYMAALEEWQEKISAPKSSSSGKPSSGGSGSGSTEPTWAGKGDPDYGGGDPNAWKNDPRGSTGSGGGSSGPVAPLPSGGEKVTQAGAPSFAAYANLADGVTLYQQAYAEWLATVTGTPAATVPAADATTKLADSVKSVGTNSGDVIGPITNVAAAESATTQQTAALEQEMARVAATSGTTSSEYIALAMQAASLGMVSMETVGKLQQQATAEQATGIAAATASPSILALEQATIATVAAAAAVVPAATGAGTAIAGSGASADIAAKKVDAASLAYNAAKMAADEAAQKVLESKTALDAAAGAANTNAAQVENARRAYDNAKQAASDAAKMVDESGRALARAKQEAAQANTVLGTTATNLNTLKTSAIQAGSSFVSMGKEYLTARNSIQSNPITSIHTIKTIVEGGGANVAPGASATKYYPGAAKTSVLDRERATIKKFHSGGTFEAPAGQSEGFAKLLDGERVLSRAETKEYEGGGIAAAVAAGIAKGLAAVGLGSGGGDVIVHGDVKLSEDYSYDRFREDVGRWKSSRIAKGVL